MRHTFIKFCLLFVIFSLGSCTVTDPIEEIEDYQLVPNWATLPQGMHLGHPQDFPMPSERAKARTERENQRAAAISRGETPPIRQPSVQPGVSGVWVDQNDHIYVFNRGKHPVIVFDSDGNVLRTGAEGITGTVPHFIKVDTAGNVWLVDEAAHRVLKMDREMKTVLMEIGVKDEAGYDQFHLDLPADVAITNTGDILIADGYGNNRIAKYSANGEFIKEWGGGPDDESTKDGEFHLPHQVLVDSKNKVYVLDRENHRVQMFDTDGNFLGKLEGLGYIWGIALSADENYMFMTEHETEQVLKVSLPEGTIVSRWGSLGREPGQFDWAHGLGVDSQGAVYVGDTYGQRLQKFIPTKGITEN